MSIEYPYVLDDFMNYYCDDEHVNRDGLIRFIDNNVGKLNKSDRVYMLLAITNSIGENRIEEKGTGSTVKYKDLSNKMINAIYGFVNKRLSVSKEAFIKTLH